jgi:general secretion pathway protein G
MRSAVFLILIFSGAAHAQSEKSAEALTSATEIRFWLDMFYSDCRHYPSTRDGLEALIKKPKHDCEKWGPEPYIYLLPKDPWNRPWNYVSDGKSFELKSLGADGRDGGVGENADFRYPWPPPDDL